MNKCFQIIIQYVHLIMSLLMEGDDSTMQLQGLDRHWLKFGEDNVY
jgi:hypothetical protein